MKTGRPFFEIFAGHFRSAAPERDVDEGDFFTLSPRCRAVYMPIDRDSEIGDRAALRRVTHLGVAREVSEQENFIETGHAASSSGVYFSAATLFLAGRSFFSRSRW